MSMSHAEGIVFVVDDDLSVLRSLKLLISYAGWQPAMCASAEEFLALPRVAFPSCLVLDVGLPDINGLELQKLVADRIEMPIIFITGDGDVPVTVQAMKAGAVEFLTKPFGDEVLLNGISEITVKVHRGSMMEKMHANSFLELIKMAARLGLIPATKEGANSHA